jgi:outer membrane lipoprotein-sorting protein
MESRMTISRRVAIGALAGCLSPWPSSAFAAERAGPLSAEDKADVDRVVAYLQSLTSVRGRFVQTDSRGGQATGTFSLQRPGMARFDYDPPAGLTIVADGHEVSEIDRRLKTRHVYPLGWTPLALFLSKDIRLDRRIKVARIQRGAGTLRVVAQDGAARAQGAIALDFTDPPLALAGWALLESRGGAVTVRLESFATVEPRDPSYFRLSEPRRAPAAATTPAPAP